MLLECCAAQCGRECGVPGASLGNRLERWSDACSAKQGASVKAADGKRRAVAA